MADRSGDFGGNSGMVRWRVVVNDLADYTLAVGIPVSLVSGRRV